MDVAAHCSDPTGFVVQNYAASRGPINGRRPVRGNQMFAVIPNRTVQALAYTADGIPTEPLEAVGAERSVAFEGAVNLVPEVVAGERDMAPG